MAKSNLDPSKIAKLMQIDGFEGSMQLTSKTGHRLIIHFVEDEGDDVRFDVMKVGEGDLEMLSSYAEHQHFERLIED